MTLLDPQQAYTFSDIFKLKLETEALVAEFGYAFSRQMLTLPIFNGELDRINETRRRIEELLPFVSLTSETARREILIFPVVADLVHYTHSQLRIEYSVKVDSHLQGSLDYYLRSKTQMLVIEAKQEDFTNGFTQLCAELVALDRWSNSMESSTLLGAITTGTLWQFAVLNRQTKGIIQGLNSFRNPEDLEPLERVLIQALIN